MEKGERTGGEGELGPDEVLPCDLLDLLKPLNDYGRLTPETLLFLRSATQPTIQRIRLADHHK